MNYLPVDTRKIPIDEEDTQVSTARGCRLLHTHPPPQPQPTQPSPPSPTPCDPSFVPQSVALNMHNNNNSNSNMFAPINSSKQCAPAGPAAHTSSAQVIVLPLRHLCARNTCLATRCAAACPEANCFKQQQRLLPALQSTARLHTHALQRGPLVQGASWLAG